MKGYKVPQHMVEGRKNWIAQYQKDDKYALGMSAVVEDIESLPLEELDDNWHTGTPTEEGDYLVAVSYYPLISVEYQINRYLLEPYNDFIYQIEGEGRIVAWQKIEPYRG